MFKGLFMVAVLAAVAVLAVSSTGEIISQAGVRPASFATWDLEVNLTPWGYVEFSQIPFVPIDAEKGGYGEVEGQPEIPEKKMSEKEALQQLLQQRVPCRWDWDCKKLSEKIIPLDQNICVGQPGFYDGRSDPLLTIRPNLANELLGKEYTDYIQVGYAIDFKCGPEKYCVPDKINYDKGLLKCKYGCLVTPVTKNGKTYSNFCVCKSGIIGETFCDPSRGRHVYYYRLDWTCEKSVEIAGYCPIGSKCTIDRRAQKWTCEPLSAEEFLKQRGITTSQPTSQNDGITYVLLFPGDLEMEPITVAAIQNGRIIAERPISNLTALEYVTKYGPVDAGRAYEFAQKTGLTAIVERIRGIANFGAIGIYHSILW